MNPRTVIRFFQTTSGRFLGFLLIGGMILGFFYVYVRRQTTAPVAEKASSKTRPVSETQTHLLGALPTKAEKPTPPRAPNISQTPMEVPSPISLYSAPVASPSDPDFGPDYLPFGRLIKCVLVITVDSANIATPIIGLVTEDVCRDGRVIIPVGTEVHGRAQSERARDRVSSDSSWVIVWPGGEELMVSGLALDQARDSTGAQITDGSAGIRGQFIKADHFNELKVFAAAFLSGATDLLQDRQPSLLGLQVVPKAKNAALGGAHEVVDAWARQLSESILQESHFVRCVAGKPWYLYATQAIDRSKAARAGSRFHLDLKRLQSAEGKSPEFTTAKKP